MAKSVKTADPKGLQKSGLLDNTGLKTLLCNHERTEQYKLLLQTRSQLPVYKYRENILSVLHKENIVLIAGETGSGKSTQIPQFILQVCCTYSSDYT